MTYLLWIWFIQIFERPKKTHESRTCRTVTSIWFSHNAICTICDKKMSILHGNWEIFLWIKKKTLWGGTPCTTTRGLKLRPSLSKRRLSWVAGLLSRVQVKIASRWKLWGKKIWRSEQPFCKKKLSSFEAKHTSTLSWNRGHPFIVCSRVKNGSHCFLGQFRCKIR